MKHKCAKCGKVVPGNFQPLVGNCSEGGDHEWFVVKFERNTQFDTQFLGVPEIRWYPYVGKHFGENGRRIMVYAHNIPIEAATYDQKKSEWSPDKAAWADCLEQYAYCQGSWTNAFRYFIKGAIGLKVNYGEKSGTSKEIAERVDSFVERIAYLNFIQDLVKSDKTLACAEPDQIELSKKANGEILRILDITHCICWGKPTYQYVCSITGFNAHPENALGKRGFSSCIIDVGGGKAMQCLRIHHPSMPRFGPYSGTTHSIISRFLGMEEAGKQNNMEQATPDGAPFL